MRRTLALIAILFMLRRSSFLLQQYRSITYIYCMLLSGFSDWFDEILVMKTWRFVYRKLNDLHLTIKLVPYGNREVRMVIFLCVYSASEQTTKVLRQTDAMKRLLDKRPQLPSSISDIFLVSCLDSEQVSPPFSFTVEFDHWLRECCRSLQRQIARLS